MYLLLAAIILVLLFAASYGGPSTWVTLGSTTLTVLLVAGCVFIANAKAAAPFFGALAAQAPAFFSSGLQDLAFAADRTAAAARQRPAVVEAEATRPPLPLADDGTGGAWLDVGWFAPSDWLSAAAGWINPWRWFEGQPDSVPAADSGAQKVGQAAAPPQQADAPTPRAPMPTVRAMMDPGDQTQNAPQPREAAAPGYKIVTAPLGGAEIQIAPPQDETPATETPGNPVRWLKAEAPPAGMNRVVLSGANASNLPLENIRATLRPDARTGTPTSGSVALTLQVEGQDGTALPGTSIPAGARFHLQAAGLSEAEAQQLQGAIVSFAYSEGGRRRTSIMYLKDTTPAGGSADMRQVP